MLGQQQIVRQRAAGWARILGGPTGGANVLYLDSDASVTKATDNTLVTVPPNSENSTTTSIIPGVGWFILYAQGTLGSSPGVGEPGQNDQGFLWDSTSLEGRTLVAGTYSGFLKIATTSGTTGVNGADIHLRVSKRNAAGTVFTTIVDLTLANQNITTTPTVYTIPAGSGPATAFGGGDKLYVDVLIHVNSGLSSATGFKLFQNGGVNESLTIPANVGTVSVIVPRTVQPVVAVEDSTYQGRPAESFRFGGLPSRGATPPSLRNLVQVDPPDTAGLTYWQRANETNIYGGLPSRGVTPPSLRTPQVVLAEDVLTNSVPPYGTVLRRLGTLPSVTAWNKPLVVTAEDTLSSPKHPEGMVLGGKPSRAVTPPSLRPVVFALTAEDILSPLRHPEGLAIVERKAQGASQLLPAPLVVLAEDVLSRERPPPYATILYANVRAVQAPPQRPMQSMPEDQSPWYVPSAQIWWNPFTTVVNLPEIPPPPINARPDDSLAVMYTEPVLLWTRPNRPTVHPSVLIPGLITTEDVYSPEAGRAQVYRTSRFPPGGPPSLRPIVSPPAEEQGILYTGRSAGEVLIITIVPRPPITPPVLRQPLIVVPEDTLTNQVPATTWVWRTAIFNAKHWQPIIAQTPDVLSEQVPAEGRIYGGRAPANVTPRTLRTPQIIIAEDPTPLPRHPEGMILGGRPNAPTGKPSLRPVIYATTEDVMSLQRNPEAWLLAGPVINPVKGLPRQIVVTADDVLSPQRLPDPLVLGGRPNAKATPRSLRTVLVVPQEDVLSRIPPPSFTYGGQPNKAVTPKTLRSILVAGTPDVYSTENVPPPVLLKGYPHTIISQVPVTPLQDIYVPVIKIKGKVGGTTDG